MHLIGFSHNYTKLNREKCGILLSVRSTENIRPSAWGISCDTEYTDFETRYNEDGVPIMRIKEASHYPLKIEDFAKPLLQLVFIGDIHQIPFTTYREFPKDYKPFYPGRRTYRKTIPYSDLIGDLFAFKFKGEKLPWGVRNKISTRTGSHVEIFN